jgi:hypothetical protein
LLRRYKGTLHWDGWSINLPDVVLLHHLPCGFTVPDIFEIAGCIFPWLHGGVVVRFEY